jgi:isopenicillin N synthase-like dioxygenase
MPATKDLNQHAPSIRLAPDELPVIDLGALFGNRNRTLREVLGPIRKACLDTGFFYITNTCVADSVITNALNAMKLFFDCPDESPVKQNVHNAKAAGMKGWGPMFGEPAYQAGTVAHMESFDFGQQLEQEQYRSLEIVPNIWPELAGFRETMLAYYEQVTRLGRALSQVISNILGESPDFINSRSGPTAPRTMRMLHYPASETPGDRRNVGISAHTDFECFTILYQTAAGLELTNAEGTWCEAPADPGTFTVMLGDMTERFSNGWLRATGHRVANTPWSRYSMVLFFALDADCLVEPLPQFVTADHPSAYAPVTQDEHIDRELKRANRNKAVSP